MRNIYVVGGDTSYANWLEGNIVSSVKDADIVLFTGGEDVSPSLYNEPCSNFTHCNPHRDASEKLVFNQARELEKHMIGICRGAQLLCVLSGGRLVQHQENKNRYHKLYFKPKTNEEMTLPAMVSISSEHHQLAYPFDMHPSLYRVLASAAESRFHLDGKGVEMLGNVPEPEIVYYPLTRCLGIQGHPEWMYPKKELYNHTFNLLNYLVTNFLKDKL